MKSNWKSCLIAAAALIAVATIHAQSSGTYTVHNLTVNGTATGSFGGGGSGTFQSVITDLRATRSTHTNANDLITIAAGRCMGTDKSAATIRITAGSGSGSYVAYCTDSQTIVVEHSTSAGLTVTASGLTPLQLTTPAIPDGMVPIATGTITSGAWDAPTDARDWALGGQRHTNGAGMAVECSGGSCVHAVDTAQVWVQGNTLAPAAGVDFTGATITEPFRETTSDPGTCSGTEVWRRTDTGEVKHCVGGVATVIGSETAYNPIDHTQILLVDEFATGGTGSSHAIGQLGWTWANVDGSNGHSFQAVSDEHVGIYRLTTGTFANNEAQLGNQFPGRWDNITNWEMVWIVSLPDVTSVRGVIGFLPNVAGGGYGNRITVRFDTSAGDTVFRFETCTAATCTTGNSTITPTAGSWHRVRIRSTVSGTIRFSVDGETEVAQSTNVPTATTLLPAATITTRTTAERHLDIDWFAFRRTGVSR